MPKPDLHEQITVATGHGALDQISKIISSSKEKIDCCFDPSGFAFLNNSEQLMNSIFSLKKKGVKIRCVTEITKKNIAYCRDMIKKDVELYHADGIEGNFQIVDERKCLSHSISHDYTQLLLISTPSFVKTQQFLFDSLLRIAIPAKQKIIEIQSDVESEFINTIHDRQEVQKLINSLLKSAFDEVLILFSTVASFFRAESEGILDAAGKASHAGVNVRILVIEDKEVKEVARNRLKEKYDKLAINYLQQLLPSRITTFIIDQAYSLAIEISDDTSKTFLKSVGLATYSNSEPTVFSNISMFNSLWIQSEINRQNKIRQAYFQMFKDFSIKDEIYNRKWSDSKD